MILDTPDIVKADGFSCGATCLEILFRFHGAAWNRQFRSLANHARGLLPETAEAVLRAAFKGISLGGGWDLDDLAFHVRRGRPLMSLVGTDEPGDHWVVVRGVSRGRVYYHCPGVGRGSKVLSDWLAWWRGPEGLDRFALTGWPVTPTEESR